MIVELIGGLGNQMFQYAVGRCMAETLQTSVLLDVSGFEKYPLRHYELNNFNIHEQFATEDDLRMFSLSKSKLLMRSLESLIWKRTDNRFKCIHEGSFTFDPSVLQQKGNLYLRGYWQSEKYFTDIAPIIYQEFSSRTLLSERSIELLGEMRKPGSVAIHIRRGDYVTNPQTNKMHGVMSLDYYQKCMDYIAARHDNVVYYLFSDDIEWVRQNFAVSDQLHIVEPVDFSQSYEDLILMSSCNHNVIANSSFSWWAAWLNVNPDKIVIAPQKWFNKVEMDTTDLIPASWIRL